MSETETHTPKEICEAVERHQKRTDAHPFTCANNGDHKLLARIMDGKAVLVCPYCEYIQTDIPLEVLDFSITHIYDLIYCAEAKADYKKLFPEAIIEDASDYIHEGRFSAEMDFRGKQIDYLEKLAENGMANISLTFNVVVGGDKVLAERLLARLRKKGAIK